MQPVSLLTLPLRDLLGGMLRCLDAGFRALLLLALGVLVSWFVYVPVHELLHALGCVATGGTVSELEIDAKYGGALLARVLPFVTPASDYGGRLSGFDTGGSDLVYLATDLWPYLLSVWPGVWALRRAARRGRPFWFGATLPVALAPFVSLTGDAYEIGSLLVTRVPPWSRLEPRTTLLGDDVFRVAENLSAIAAGAPEWLGLTVASLIGALWAFATYGLAARLARRLGEDDPAALRELLRTV
jgi:hypothetical protein